MCKEIKKTILLLMLITLLIINLIGCEGNNKSVYNEFDKQKLSDMVTGDTSSVNIEKNLIGLNIEQSYNKDGGFSATSEMFENKSDAYSTYYILKIKETTGLNVNDQRKKAARMFINRIDQNCEDLLQLYYTFMLCDDNDIDTIDDYKIAKIKDFLNQLLTKDGYFSIQVGVDLAESIDGLLPTYMSIYILNRIDYTITISDSWIEKIENDIQLHYKNDIQYLGYYVKYFELLKLLNMEPNEELTPDKIYLSYKDYFGENNKLKKTKTVIPVFTLDYLNLCELNNIDTEKYSVVVKNLLLDKEKLNKNVIIELDSFVYYSTIVCLAKIGYDCKNLEEETDKFNKFYLSDGTYILPGTLDSDIINTYYVYKITKILNINGYEEVNKYCEDNRNNILLGSVMDIYYYLSLLKQLDNLSLVTDIKKDLIDTINSNIRKYVNENGQLTYLALNYSIKSLLLLDNKVDNSLSKLIESKIYDFSESNDVVENIYQYTSILEIINQINCNEDMKQSIVLYLENGLTEILTTNMTGKLNFISAIVNVLTTAGSKAVDKYSTDIIKLINLSQHSSGLFKYGDNENDVVSYESTSNALELLKLLGEPL